MGVATARGQPVGAAQQPPSAARAKYGTGGATGNLPGLRRLGGGSKGFSQKMPPRPVQSQAAVSAKLAFTLRTPSEQVLHFARSGRSRHAQGRTARQS